MFLLIFESIGTQELILIGVVALIFLGPRKMPEYAKKIGKMMNEFRSTTNEFKETWEREVNFDEEAKAFRDDDVAPTEPIARVPAAIDHQSVSGPPELPAPLVIEVNPSRFTAETAIADDAATEVSESAPEPDINDKASWL